MRIMQKKMETREEAAEGSFMIPIIFAARALEKPEALKV